MMKNGSLRRRWFMNTVGVVCSLGLACVLAITAVFASFQYSDMDSDLRFRARTTVDLLEKMMAEETFSAEDCVSYVTSLSDGDEMILRFLDAEGTVLAIPGELPDDERVNTSDVAEAVQSRGICTFLGEDSLHGTRIMAVSAPVIDRSGEVIGLIRMSAPMHSVDIRIMIVAAISMLALLLIVAVVLIISNFYIRSILVPIEEITEKAKRIAGGTYGIQITSKYNDEIGALVESVNDMSAQIAQNEKTQTEFISSLSHELRTPLTAITGWSETLLGEETLDQDQQRGIKIILGEAKRLTEMVVDLLDFTRIQGGRMTLNMEQTDIRAAFEDTVFMYGSRLSQDGIQLNYLDNEEEIPEIVCDAQRLRQVFLNILDNAAKHGSDGKKVDASIHYVDENVMIHIRDYGPGIPEDEIPLVKKKFYKGSSKARGSGIGLAVSDEIVGMHGGQLTLENTPDGGTLVTVSLPAVQ